MNAQLLIIDVRGLICEKHAVWDHAPLADVLMVPSGSSGGERQEKSEGVLSRREARQLGEGDMERLAQVQGVVRGRTDESGRAEMPRVGGGEAWDVYVCIRYVLTPAGERPYTELREPVCLFAGTYFVRPGVLVVHIPQRLYCLLKRRADAWTIAGRLTVCGSGQAISGATVTAFDTDWLQDDNLGTAATAANGSFRIDYPGSKFRQGSWIDVELFGGPDVYF
ncbi:MAG TPA: carboxypeptidase-like regulatory domain-containing protein, partial [Longimicrobiaceae bacterium]|nr:carboxypeptidase-like regulatory domain-containing protein [Longimicrobiaceae bacterium]